MRLELSNKRNDVNVLDIVDTNWDTYLVTYKGLLSLYSGYQYAFVTSDGTLTDKVHKLLGSGNEKLLAHYPSENLAITDIGEE